MREGVRRALRLRILRGLRSLCIHAARAAWWASGRARALAEWAMRGESLTYRAIRPIVRARAAENYAAILSEPKPQQPSGDWFLDSWGDDAPVAEQIAADMREACLAEQEQATA